MVHNNVGSQKHGAGGWKIMGEPTTANFGSHFFPLYEIHDFHSPSLFAVGFG